MIGDDAKYMRKMLIPRAAEMYYALISGFINEKEVVKATKLSVVKAI